MTRRALWLIVSAMLAGTGPVMAESATVTGDYHDARQWFRMGDIARAFESYDLAVSVYQRIIERFPDTRWARQAQRRIAAVRTEALAHLAPWDPEVGGTAPAVQAATLLRAGNMAYGMDDVVLALKFYERAQMAAPDSHYGRQAASKMRWIRRWKNPGP